ncbi:MAG: ATP-dependent Clp protease adaptor ClpS [Muribaculaceae bacterium]|nr:ATP-dependent Clp protease adaptor ClpS [Muribaculaceae bacterium]
MAKLTQHGTGTRQDTRTRTIEPRQYRVILHNDDFTTMDFVVTMLVTVFHKTGDEAIALMLMVHHKGQAVVGLFTYDMAMTRTQKAIKMARDEGFPLRITCEPE